MAAVKSGTLLDERYRLLTSRASGATANVWQAEDEFLRRIVAVKLLHDHLLQDAELLSRFRAEARTAATVNHPNLVAVYDSTTDHPGIVMEWVDGPDLRRRLDDGGLRPAEVAGLGVDLCAGLGELHRHGLVHRDVKPANVLLTPSGTPKLTDFGIATANAGDRTATGIVLGTAKYLAPEQVQGTALDGRTDVFALAAVLYECLAGRPPWLRDGDLPTAIARLEEDAPDLGRVRPEVPADLAGAIMRGLAREPEARWPSTAAFASAILGGSGLPAPPPPPAPAPRDRTRPAEPPRRDEPTIAVATTAPPARRPRRRRWPRLVGLLVMIAIAALGWTLITTLDDDPAPAAADGDIRIVAATAFDPEGSGPAGEHNDRAADAIDGDTATSWPTERYGSRTFGTKSGVGLILELDTVHDLDEVTIRTQSSTDWAVAVHVVTDVDPGGADAIADFGSPVARAGGLPTIASVPLDATGSTVVLWFTDLGEGPLPIRMNVVEVTIR
ncbi:MAG: serine/threonine-protein kinase [Acidimicrobiales bacterium]|nr:serine/threonine-protein kinase [Acidimicrobiales bacterium]